MQDILKKIEEYDGKESKKERQQKPKKRRCKQKGHNKWSFEENLKYSCFLAEMELKFETQFNRRSHQVFRHLSKVLYNRTPEQCRSHHQKMVKSYKTISGICEHFTTLTIEVLKEIHYQCFQISWKNIIDIDQENENITGYYDRMVDMIKKRTHLYVKVEEEPIKIEANFEDSEKELLRNYPDLLKRDYLEKRERAELQKNQQMEYCTCKHPPYPWFVPYYLHYANQGSRGLDPRGL